MGLSGRPTTTSLGGGDLERPPPFPRTGLLGGDAAAFADLTGAPPREVGACGDLDLAGERGAFLDEAAERWLATLPLDDGAAVFAPRMRLPLLTEDAVDPAVPGLLLEGALPSIDETASRRPPTRPGRGEIGATPLAGMVESLFLPAPAARDDALAGRRAPLLPPNAPERRLFPSLEEFSFLLRPNDDAADDDERDVRRCPRRTLDAPLAMLHFRA